MSISNHASIIKGFGQESVNVQGKMIGSFKIDKLFGVCHIFEV